jgi:hypothetical protein
MTDEFEVIHDSENTFRDFYRDDADTQQARR